jgi:prepilin-type N-terminal cleavage/methylation domain-containing protein/prepilin-type processing-associated H-X9-DG protein
MSLPCPPRTRPSGFTLIELLAAISVIAVLASILVAVVRSSTDKARAVECASHLRQIGQCVSLYLNDSSGYLPTWTTWNDGGSGNWVWDNYHYGYRADGTPVGGLLTEIAGYYPGGLMTNVQYDTPGADHLFNCPANTSTISSKGYSANTLVLKRVNTSSPNNGALHYMDIPRPGRVIMITDNTTETNANSRWFSTTTWEDNIGFDRHDGHANVLFVDLCVSSMQREDVQPRNIDPEEN